MDLVWEWQGGPHSADVVKCLEDVKQCVGETQKPKLVPVKVEKGKGGSKSFLGEMQSKSSRSNKKPAQSKKAAVEAETAQPTAQQDGKSVPVETLTHEDPPPLLPQGSSPLLRVHLRSCD